MPHIANVLWRKNHGIVVNLIHLEEDRLGWESERIDARPKCNVGHAGCTWYRCPTLVIERLAKMVMNIVIVPGSRPDKVTEKGGKHADSDTLPPA